MPPSVVYNFSKIEELANLSIKYVEFLRDDNVISEELYREYSAKIALSERCDCPQCKGERARKRLYFKFEGETWEPLWGKLKSGKSFEV